MKMEITGNRQVGGLVTGSHTPCLLSPQVPASGRLNPPGAEAFNQLAACGAVPRACLWGGVRETQHQDPGDTPTSASTRAALLCPGF